MSAHKEELLDLFQQNDQTNPKEEFINKLGIDLTMTILDAAMHSSYNVLDIIVMMDEAMERIIDFLTAK